MTVEEPSRSLPPPRRRRRFSLIWLIPAAAILSGAWLAYQSFSTSGPEIEISFENAEGLDAGHTKIRHKNVDLGTVEKISLTKDMKRVVVTASMTNEAKPFLNAGARFWVVKPHVTLGEISGLTTILSGSYIEFNPGSGSTERSFIGLQEPPALETEVPGRHFVLKTDSLGSVSQKSPIYFHGVPVGEVLETELDDEQQTVSIHVFIRAPHDKLIRPDSRFWNVSGFAINAGVQGVRLATASLQSLLMGGIAFDTPKDAVSEPESAPGSTFHLFDDEYSADSQGNGPSYSYRVNFPGSVRDLAVNAPVQLQGITIGRVTNVALNVGEDGSVSAPVTFDIEVERLLGPDAKEKFATGRDGLDQLLSKMIAHGLRAQLQSASILTGSKFVALDFKQGSAAAALTHTDPPGIPTIPGSDLDGVMASAQQVLDHVAALPLGGLVDDLRSAIRHADSTLASPELKHSLKSLDTTLANLAEISQSAKQDFPATMKSLRAAATDAQKALTGADGQAGLGDLLQELTDASRSLRLLADYLDQHPEALLRGKGAGP